MSNVLYLVHRIPFPPNKGDKIRSFNILRDLSRKHDVYLAAFIDDTEDWQHVERLERYCAELFLRPVGGWRSRVSAISAMLRGQSLSVGFYKDRAMQEWVSSVVESKDISSVIAFSSTVAQYLPSPNKGDLALIADFVDLDSDKWRQYSRRSWWPKSMIYAYEAAALKRWEQYVLERVNAVTLVSDEERRLMLQDDASMGSKVHVVRNGVDTDYFDPDGDLENPYHPGTSNVVFTGAMDYYANIESVTWFVESVWPGIRARRTDAYFWIVGSNPTRGVLALSSIPGVTVTGRVADIRPYLKFADVAVAPLRLARGIQNKVLEALAMNVPIVAAPQALQGLDENPPSSVAVAGEPDEFASAVLRYLESGSRTTGERGRTYVAEHFDWRTNLSKFGDLASSLRPGN
jgi:sugar transferase (PEP-CTERM/EpsH1 system associated)